MRQLGLSLAVAFALATSPALAAEAESKSVLSRYWKWGCGGILASVVLGSIYLYWTNSGEMPKPELPLEELKSGPETERQLLDERVAKLETRLAVLPLETAITGSDGGAVRFTMFRKSAIYELVASRIKEGIKKEQPNVPEEELGSERPGLHFRLDAISFAQDGGRIRVRLHGAGMAAESVDTFTARELLAGRAVRVPFQTVVRDTPDGSARFDATISLRYDARAGRFVIDELKAGLGVVAPGLFKGSDEAQLKDLVSARWP